VPQATSKPIYQRPVTPLDLGDHFAMRQRVQDVYINWPKEPKVRRIRPPVVICPENLTITYDVHNSFSVRIYDPAAQSAEIKSLRPALLMCHGGGWTHGTPEMDGGKAT
jgi:acetyl esterase/lipase